MPLYEYKCPNCNREVERLVHFDDDNPMCDCGAIMRKQIPSNTHFRLKGEGWEGKNK